MDKHILIVEDEPLLALDLESLIAELVEADFVVCRLAADALHEVETKAFDFAFLDVDVVDGTTFDVAKALALGARAVLIGRAYLWGLAANGQAGVENVLDLMRGGIDSALLGLGHRDIGQLNRADLVLSPDFERR